MRVIIEFIVHLYDKYFGILEYDFLISYLPCCYYRVLNIYYE